MRHVGALAGIDIDVQGKSASDIERRDELEAQLLPGSWLADVVRGEGHTRIPSAALASDGHRRLVVHAIRVLGKPVPGFRRDFEFFDEHPTVESVACVPLEGNGQDIVSAAQQIPLFAPSRVVHSRSAK